MRRLGRCTNARTTPPAVPSSGCNPAPRPCDRDQETVTYPFASSPTAALVGHVCRLRSCCLKFPRASTSVAALHHFERRQDRGAHSIFQYLTRHLMPAVASAVSSTCPVSDRPAHARHDST